MGFCTNCGAPLEDGIPFCPKCGTMVDAPEPTPEPEPVKKPSKLPLVVAIVGTCAAAGLIGALLYFHGTPGFTFGGGGTEAAEATGNEQQGLVDKDKVDQSADAADEDGTAEPVQTYVVTFDSAGGSPVDAQVVASGETAQRPADPVRDGYVFKGWRSGGASHDFSLPVTSDQVVYAEWEAVPQPEPEPAPQPTPQPSAPQVDYGALARSFPRTWSGHYRGTLDGETINRPITFYFTDVTEGGYLAGTAEVYVEEAARHGQPDYSTFQFEGSIDWDSGYLIVYGTSWIVQGDQDWLRSYDGYVDFNSWGISGDTWNENNENYRTWEAYGR